MLVYGQDLRLPIDVVIGRGGTVPAADSFALEQQ